MAFVGWATRMLHRLLQRVAIMWIGAKL